MIRFIFKEERQSTDIEWFYPDHSVKAVKEKYQEMGNLLYENFSLIDNGLTSIYVAIWSDRESYGSFINETEIIYWRTEKMIYNSTYAIKSGRLVLDEI